MRKDDRSVLLAIVTYAAAGLATFFVVSACSSTPVQADDPNNTSVKVADNGSYGTYYDTHTVDGRTIACIVVRTNQAMSLSCNWPPQ